MSSTMPLRPDLPDPPSGAAAPGRVYGAAFAGTGEPREVRWAAGPVAAGPGEHLAAAGQGDDDGEAGPTMG